MREGGKGNNIFSLLLFFQSRSSSLVRPTILFSPSHAAPGPPSAEGRGREGKISPPFPPSPPAYPGGVTTYFGAGWKPPPPFRSQVGLSAAAAAAMEGMDGGAILILKDGDRAEEGLLFFSG